MTNTDTARNTFSKTIECLIENCDHLEENIHQISKLISNQFLEGNKLLSCGNGSGASDAQYFCSCLINRFERERPSLPAICLSADVSSITGIANDHNFNDIYSKQIKALGNPGDILFVIFNSGKSSNLIQAIQAAHEKQMFVIILSSNHETGMEQMISDNDIELRVQHTQPSRVKEVHLVAMHCVCELIDQNLFGI